MGSPPHALPIMFSRQVPKRFAPNSGYVLPALVPHSPPSFTSNGCELQKLILTLPMGSPPHGEPSPCPPHASFSFKSDSFHLKVSTHHLHTQTHLPCEFGPILMKFFVPYERHFFKISALYANEYAYRD